MPELGMADAAVGYWYIGDSQPVDEGERLVEILCGPAVVDLSAPVSGIFSSRLARTGDRVLPGQVLGYIEETVNDP